MRPDPDLARSWLESELAKPEYHQQSLLDRLLDWLDRVWAGLSAAASGADGLSTTAAVVLALLVVALALVVVPRIRRTPSTRGDQRTPLTDERVSAEAHRARGEAALVEGRYAEAVVEAMRALARRMVDRGVLDETPGSTAHEIATAIGGVFPHERGRLLTAAEVFDAAQYGGQTPSREQAATVLALHDDLRRARPVAVAGTAAEVGAVPR